MRSTTFALKPRMRERFTADETIRNGDGRSATTISTTSLQYRARTVSSCLWRLPRRWAQWRENLRESYVDVDKAVMIHGGGDNRVDANCSSDAIPQSRSSLIATQATPRRSCATSFSTSRAGPLFDPLSRAISLCHLSRSLSKQCRVAKCPGWRPMDRHRRRYRSPALVQFRTRRTGQAQGHNYRLRATCPAAAPDCSRSASRTSVRPSLDSSPLLHSEEQAVVFLNRYRTVESSQKDLSSATSHLRAARTVPQQSTEPLDKPDHVAIPD